MKKLSLILALLANNIITNAQHQDAIISLGDTISINSSEFSKFTSTQKQLFQPIIDLNNKYIVNQLGEFTLKNKKYQIADPLDDGVTKMLILGNSFSDDGVEFYLHDMAKQAGKTLVIGNLFRGGAPLDFHLKNANENNKIYSYRKTTIDGIKSNTDKTSILEALKSDNWDYICFQQASLLSDDLESVEKSLPPLLEYIQKNYPISTVKYLYHQTWAYAENASTKNFEKYNKDQQLMYNKIVEVSKNLNKILPNYTLVPSGTAIQNGRTSYIGDNFTREGYHLDFNIGRFTAASTWYETLFKNVKQNPYKPYTLNDTQAQIAKEAAYHATQQPYKISNLQDFQTQQLINEPIGKIQINLASTMIIPGWNTLFYDKKETKLSSLYNNDNKSTSVNLSVLTDFDGRGSKGLKKIKTSFKMPQEISTTHFQVKINDITNNQRYFQFENLNPNKNYEINIFGSINDSTTNELFYIVEGQHEAKQTLNPGMNRFNTLIFQNIKPKKDGTIAIAFRKSNKDALAVVNAISIEEK